MFSATRRKAQTTEGKNYMQVCPVVSSGPLLEGGETVKFEKKKNKVLSFTFDGFHLTYRV
jgi:hypothetical protein